MFSVGFFYFFLVAAKAANGTDDVDEKPELSKEKGSSRGQRGLMRKEEEEKGKRN